MHWSNQVASRVIERGSDPVVVASGISLSGPVHIGHSREFLTAGLIAHQIVQQGQRVRFVAIADDIDPLRRVYPFLPESFSEWVGCPLNAVPDPWGCHDSYAAHFLDQLMQGFAALGLRPEVLRSSEMYEQGCFTNLVKQMLAARHQIGKIIHAVTTGKGEPLDDQWFFQPLCPTCQSLSATQVVTWHDGADEMEIWCKRCNQPAHIDLRRGNGKLAWRCDWPMRWSYLGVDVEPFGHDHSSSGGSFQSGERIAQEVLGINAPVPVPYGWIHFREGGAMHSSSGRAVSITELVECYPPEVIWWMIVRNRPEVTIKFDAVKTLLDESRLLRQALTKPQTSDDVEVAQIVRQAVGVREELVEYPLDHLILVSQIGQFDPGATLQVLRRSVAYQAATTLVGSDTLHRLCRWLETYGQEYRLQVRESGSVRPVLDDGEERVRQRLVLTIDQVEWCAEAIHRWIRDCSEKVEVKVGVAFCAIYRLILGQTHGPKAGWLLETLGRDAVRSLLG